MNSEIAMKAAAPAASEKRAARDKDLLVWRKRESSRNLLMAMIYSLGVACATGIVLLLPLNNGHVTLVVLVAHLVSGLLGLMFFVPFLLVHLNDGKEPLSHIVMPWRMLRKVYRNEALYHRLLGFGLTWSALLSMLSGLIVAAPAVAFLAGRPVVFPFGTSAALLQLHLAASVLLVLFLVLHFPKRGQS